MTDEQFKKAKEIKAKIAMCNSVLETVSRSSGGYFVHPTIHNGINDCLAEPLPGFCCQYIVDGLNKDIERLKKEFEEL